MDCFVASLLAMTNVCQDAGDLPVGQISSRGGHVSRSFGRENHLCGNSDLASRVNMIVSFKSLAQK
jgi:hypothetical protein